MLFEKLVGRSMLADKLVGRSMLADKLVGRSIDAEKLVGRSIRFLQASTYAEKLLFLLCIESVILLTTFYLYTINQ